MDKKQIQQRVLQGGKPLKLTKFSWREKTKTFSSNEDGLVIDFSNIDNSTIKAGWKSTITAGPYSTITAGWYSTIKAGSYSTITAGSYSTITAGWNSTITAGEYSVIVNRNVFEVIQPQEGDVIQICPQNIPGHLVNGIYNGEPHIISDGILSKIIKKKGGVYHVINHGENNESILIEKDGVYSHGKTLKDARESLVYKITDKDTSAYEGLTDNSVVGFEEAVRMYRTITGACAEGCKYFVSQNPGLKKDSYTISELIEATHGQYKSDVFAGFFSKATSKEMGV